MTSSVSSTPTLSAALASLLEVAMAAGAPESDVRAEAEALAATVAEAATGAWVDWVAQTGGDRSAEDFATAASRGRRWRSTPTPTLARLAAERSPEAPHRAQTTSRSRRSETAPRLSPLRCRREV